MVPINNISNSDYCEGSATNLSTEAVDGFERKSFEVLEYVSNLEAKLLQEKDEFLEKEMQLLADRKAIQQKMELALQHANLEKSRLQQQNDKIVNDADSTIHSLTNDLDSSSLSLIKERRKALELENLVAELKQEIDHQERVHNRRKARDEKEKARLYDELNALQKKANLGRILGRLQEDYLSLDNEEDEDSQTKNGGEFNDKKGRPFKRSLRNPKLAVKLESLERKVQSVIDSCLLQPPNPADAADHDNDSSDFDSDSEIASGRDEEAGNTAKSTSADQRVRESQQRRIRRAQSVPPPLRKRRDNIEDDDASPRSGLRGTMSSEQHDLKTVTEMTSETETETRTAVHGLKWNYRSWQPRARSVLGGIISSGPPRTPAVPSPVHCPDAPRSEMPVDASFQARSPDRTPKSQKDMMTLMDQLPSSPKDEKELLSRSEIVGPQRDVQKPVSAGDSDSVLSFILQRGSR